MVIIIYKQNKYTQGKMQMQSQIHNKFLHTPILEGTIWQISSNDQRNFLFSQFLHGNTQWISFTFQVYKNWGIHGNLQSSCTQNSCSFIFGHIWGSGSFFLWNSLFLKCLSSYLLLLLEIFWSITTSDNGLTVRISGFALLELWFFSVGLFIREMLYIKIFEVLITVVKPILE